MRHGQSRFNAVFGTTRVDPGIPDPGLTGHRVRNGQILAYDPADARVVVADDP